MAARAHLGGRSRAVSALFEFPRDTPPPDYSCYTGSPCQTMRREEHAGCLSLVSSFVPLFGVADDDVMAAWAGHLSCTGKREDYATRADGKEYDEWTDDGRSVGNLSCVRPHGRCQAASAGHSDQRAPELVNCAYDGTHYSNMMGDAPEVIWEFFLKQRRHGPITFANPPLGALPMPRRINLKEVRKFERGGHQRHRPRHYNRYCYTWPDGNSNGASLCSSYLIARPSCCV